jgi:hypothetical protein
MRWFFSKAIVIALCTFSASILIEPKVQAQDEKVQAQDEAVQIRRARHCTNGTASGTYGYRMTGQIVNLGPFLVNGIFTHNYNGTMDADVQLVVGPQSFPALGTGGTWKINDDCTGSGKFTVAALDLEVTYNFIATDGGDQIELLNTNAGIVLNGVGRRISKAWKAPSCNSGTIAGAYGYRLDGSLPNLPFVAFAGTLTHSPDDKHNGTWSGTDVFNMMGVYFPRENDGTYTLARNCRGTGFYQDSLGNQVNYVFTVVDQGDTIFLMGIEPGVAVSGVARRIR